jgi:hypothetical protein
MTICGTFPIKLYELPVVPNGGSACYLRPGFRAL